MTKMGGNLAGFVAGSPVDIRTRRTNDRRTGILCNHQPIKCDASLLIIR
jgi:hypothetical protein